MKALVLLPLHESSEYIALALMVGLQKRGYDVLSVPSYANYLLEVKLAKNFEQSVLMALMATKQFATNEDWIIIGNCDRSYNCDIIINVNIHHEEGEAILDLQLAKLRELYGDDEQLGDIVNHLYDTTDGEYSVGGSVEQIVELVDNLCQAIKN